MVVPSRCDRPEADVPGRVRFPTPRRNVRQMAASQRVEHDSLGDVQVPTEALWRAQTQRAVENFDLSGQPLPPAFIHALARVKAAAARANADVGVLDQELAKAIAASADDVASGNYDDQFPVDVFQTGSGTSTNMNANEVIATLAQQRLGSAVHANDHVNASQSSNDVFPTALHVATAHGLTDELIPALRHLAAVLRTVAEENTDTVKPGRTHLMDAAPLTLGQEMGGWARQADLGVERLESVLPRLLEIPLGGTAVGTGLNAPDGFESAAVGHLSAACGLRFSSARDHFEAQAARDAVVETSGQLRVCAISLLKMANDLRWMGSGPRAGLGEITLPALQPGSSIMPGKVNPVIAEAVAMAAAQVIGNDAAIAVAGASGNFQLNVMMPVMARNLLEQIRLLSRASTALADRAVAAMSVNRDALRAAAESSPVIATSLVPMLGYERVASLVARAQSGGTTIAQAIADSGFYEAGLVTREQVAQALDLQRLTRRPRN
jgi:fumarate hydratase, class II